MRILSALALATVAASGAASAEAVDSSLTATVSYADVNVGDPAGFATILGRVKAASNQVCRDLKISPIEETIAVANCRTSMTDSAKRQLHVAVLSSPRGTLLASR